MTKTNTLAAKLSVAFVAIAMVFTMFAPATQAQTVEELQAQIAELMAQINQLTSQVAGGDAVSSSSVCPYTWTRTLNMGATGDDVMKLQQFLNSSADTQVAAAGSAGSPGMETSYYGPATGAAVAKFQEKHRMDVLAPLGLVNSTTFFGNSTMAKANALCAAAPVVDDEDDDATEDEDDDDTTQAPLSGGEGDLLVEELFAGAETLSLGEGRSVLEVEVEAEDSDIEINRIDFLFDDRPWLFFDEVNLLVDGNEVASLSGSGDFTDVQGDYRARFSGLSLVLREGDVAEVALEVVARDSLPSSRFDTPVAITHPVDGIRFVDGAGITGYSPTNAITGASAEVEDSFDDGTINVTVSSDSPEKATIVLDEDSRTNGVVVLEMDVEADDSDMEVTDFWVEFDHSVISVADAVNRARLYVGNTLLSTKAVNDEVVKFDDVDYMIDEDDTVTFRVELDFNRGDVTNIAPADFDVSTTTVKAENANFISVTEVTSVTESHNLIVSGLVADINEITVSKANEGKEATITYKMDVTAYDSAFWIEDDGAATFVGSIAGPGTTTVSTSSVSVSGVTKNNDGFFRIQKGQTRTVTVSFIVTDTVGGFITGELIEMNYNDAADGNGTTSQAPLGGSEFEVPTNTSVSASGA